MYYEKAMNLINEENQKPRLLSDIARAYSVLASTFTEIDEAQADKLYLKSNSFYEDATQLDPSDSNTYSNWAFSLYAQGDYKESLEMAEKAQSLGANKLRPDFIKEVKNKISESK